MNVRTWRKLTPYLLLAPMLFLLGAIVVYPLVRSIYLSFFNYVLWRPFDVPFVGLGNYAKVLQDEVFWVSLRHTLVWVFFGVSFQFLLGFALALLLHQRFRGRGLVRSVILIPWVTPGVLIALMWSWMYDGNYGVINDLLSRLHLIDNNVPWLAQATTALPAIIVTIVWQGIPFFAIMLLAALQAIPEDLYEAGRVDGASKWQAFRHITLPYLAPTIFITTLLRVIWVANSVDVIYPMTGGGPGYNSLTLSVYTFIKAQKAWDFGYAATLSLFLSALLMAVALVYLWLLRRQEVKYR